MRKTVELDALDERILGIVQEDASLTVQEIGERVGLSTTPCWRRIKQLEAQGVITKRVAIIDPATIGLGGVVFIFIRTAQHDAAWLETFAKSVRDIPEIVECHRMGGVIDYLLKCVVRDIEHYDQVYKRLISTVPGLSDVSAGFSMERLKQVTRLDVSTAR